MAGFNRDTVYADNVDFTGSTQPTPQVTVDGQLLIGSAVAPNIRVATLTAGAGISITNGAGAITIALAGGGTGIDSIAVDTGTSPVTPTVGGLVTMTGAVIAAGTTPVRTNGVALNTLAIEVQTSQAIAAADATKIGLSNFNSTHFSVAATGFVSIINAGFTWTDVTGATQAIAVQNGYLTDRGAGVTYTLPATAAIGDTFIIVGKLGLATITPNANQQLLMGSVSGAVGATGTAVATNVGDSVTFVCITSGASTVWRASSWVGSWTLTP